MAPSCDADDDRRWNGSPMPMIDVYAAAGTFDDTRELARDLARVQVLTPAGVLDRDTQLGVAKELTEIVVAAAGDPVLADRTRVLITESPDGGWGIAGHANTQADITASARAALAGADGR
jgi:phenylpyruvate tautomerase PptA (4-oxalocrotonate tautomerase family)